MVPDFLKIEKIAGVGEYTVKQEEHRALYLKEDKAFLVVNQNTLEVRTDAKLGELLKAKYESVMESRYFGKGGIEIVPAGQLSRDEIIDLVRLSYNLS